MKIKYFHITFVTLTALSVISSLLVSGVLRARAQSSRIWSDPVNLSNSGAASNPVLLVDTLGVMHAFWIDQFDGYRYVQSVDGNKWTMPRTAKYPFDREGALPVLKAGPDGLIYVFYQNEEQALIFAQTGSEKIEDPSTWEYETQLSNKVLTFDIAVDVQGILHVAYIRNDDSILGPAGVYYRRSVDEGRSWSADELLYTSQYFRTTKPNIAHVQVIESNEENNEKVFVAWDNTSLKRIFITSSTDAGSNWADAVQLKSSEDAGGYNTPYNVNMSFTDQRVLLTWEVGEPGSSQCVLYGQWSADGGSTWDDPDIILENRSICPQGIDFLVDTNDMIVALMKYEQGNPSLMAWNGADWSAPQIQNEISYFANPVTNETILLGCQHYFISGEKLFVIGCDQGSSGDIWLTSRTLDTTSNWSFSTELWSLPNLLASSSQKIPSLIYVADGEDLNVLWAQSPMTGARDLEGAIYNSGRNGSQWLPAQGVITGLDESVGKLSATLNEQQDRLLLVWSSEKNGNLLFSWANSSRAHTATEWDVPHTLPSPSQWTSSPDIVVDALGRIVVVYAVPFNENRGVYIVQSVDNGITWSEPVRVFDGAAIDWEMVNSPKIAISGDGRLHVIFNRFSGLENHPEGLYYSQSEDGGVTWSYPEVVSEGSVVWSEVVSFDRQTIHRLWQVYEKSIVANLHQVSKDGGASWSLPNYITDVNDTNMPVTLAVNDIGELHMIQLVTDDTPGYLKEYHLSIKDWKWNGVQWDNQPSQTIKIKGEKADFSIAAGITSNGFISISVVAAYYDLNGDMKNEIYNIDRSLNVPRVTGTPSSPIISTPVNAPSLTQLPNVQLSRSSAEPTINPVFVEETSSGLSKNMVGIIWVIIVLGLVMFIFLRRARYKDQN